MAWEKRGTKRYYTRSVRREGRVVRQYFGNGPVAELAAATDAERRLSREIVARERRAEQGRYDAAFSPLQELCKVTDLLAAASLLLAGYHRHARGDWRRRRGCPR
jgi:hypothetical protein